MSIRDIVPNALWIKLRFTKAALGRVLYRILWIFPVDPSKVVFSNFNGKGYGDSPKYIAEELFKRGKRDLYWLLHDTNQSLPDEINPLKKGTIITLYHLATAGLWVDNNRKDPYVVKRRNQFYYQTWHGSIALKKIEQDAGNSIDNFYKSNAIRDSKMIDLMTSDSLFSDRLYRESFWYDGEIKRLGTPRLDALFDKTKNAEIKDRLMIQKDEYVVLYAPTFRNSFDMSVYNLDLVAVKTAFEMKMNSKVRILVRMHPNIPNGSIAFDEDLAMDVTLYPDIYDLMNISDALITDYSSSMFEFPIVEPKPVFSYAKDRDSYDRGFYFELDKLPFLFARTNEELIEGISTFEQAEYEKELREFYRSIELQADGHASEHIVDYIMSVMEIGDRAMA